MLTAIQLDCGVVLQARVLSRAVEAMHLAAGAEVEIAIAPGGHSPDAAGTRPEWRNDEPQPPAPGFRFRPAAGAAQS